MIPILVVGVGVEQRDDTLQRQFRREDFVCVHDVVQTGLLFTATRCLHDLGGRSTRGPVRIQLTETYVILDVHTQDAVSRSLAERGVEKLGARCQERRGQRRSVYFFRTARTRASYYSFVGVVYSDILCCAGCLKSGSWNKSCSRWAPSLIKSV